MTSRTCGDRHEYDSGPAAVYRAILGHSRIVRGSGQTGRMAAQEILMDPYLKHTLLAMLVGFWISSQLVLDFWPSVILGLILAMCARTLANWEEAK